MPQTTEEERKKGAILAALGAAGAGGTPGFMAFVLASGGGRAAAAALAAGLACGGYGAALTYKALNAPAPRAFQARLAAPADPNLRTITPQTSLSVVGITADAPALPAARPTDAQAALAAAQAQPQAPDAAPAPDPAALASDAGAAVRAAVAGRAGPNHIVARRSAFGAGARGVTGAGPQPGADSAPFAAVRPGATAAAPAAPAAPAPTDTAGSAASAGQARAMDREAARRIAAAAGRASGAGGRAGAMRQLAGANALSRGGGGAEASVTRGAQAFDGSAAVAQAAPDALGPTEAAKEAAAATPEDYGEGSAPLNTEPQSGGAAVAPAPDAGHGNATPWQSWVDNATYLMVGAIALLLAAAVLGKLAWTAACTPGGQAHAITLFHWAKYLSLAAGLMGLAIVAIGGQIMSMGQTKQALVMLVGGSMITAVSAFAFLGAGAAANGVHLAVEKMTELGMIAA
jgi:hypothetical protein